MGELKLGGSEFGGESGLGGVLLLVQDGADAEELVGVHRGNGVVALVVVAAEGDGGGGYESGGSPEKKHLILKIGRAHV